VRALSCVLVDSIRTIYLYRSLPINFLNCMLQSFKESVAFNYVIVSKDVLVMWGQLSLVMLGIDSLLLRNSSFMGIFLPEYARH